MKTISTRLLPLSENKAAGQRGHDLRDPGHNPFYVDASRTAQNTAIIIPPMPHAISQEIARHRQVSGQQKLRADAQVVWSGIITWGREAQDIISAMTVNQQNDTYLRVSQRIAREVQRELIGLVVHRDEAAPHAHFTLRGYVFDPVTGREAAPRLTPVDMRRVQDAAGEEVAGLGIVRGVSKALRIEQGDAPGAFLHRSVKKLHADLPADMDAIERKLKAEAAYRERGFAVRKQVLFVLQQMPWKNLLEFRFEMRRMDIDLCRRGMDGKLVYVHGEPYNADYLGNMTELYSVLRVAGLGYQKAADHVQALPLGLSLRTCNVLSARAAGYAALQDLDVSETVAPVMNNEARRRALFRLAAESLSAVKDEAEYRRRMFEQNAISIRDGRDKKSWDYEYDGRKYRDIEVDRLLTRQGVDEFLHLRALYGEKLLEFDWVRGEASGVGVSTRRKSKVG